MDSVFDGNGISKTATYKLNVVDILKIDPIKVLDIVNGHPPGSEP